MIISCNMILYLIFSNELNFKNRNNPLQSSIQEYFLSYQHSGQQQIRNNHQNRYKCFKEGKHESKYTQKRQMKNCNLLFETALEVEFQQKDLHKTHRSQKCQCMLYKFKDFQGKQNRQLIGMASISVNSIKFQQCKKRVRLTNSIDKDAYVQFTFQAFKISSNYIQQQFNSRVSSPQQNSLLKLTNSMQIKFPEQNYPLSNFQYSNQKNNDSQNKTNNQIDLCSSRNTKKETNEFYINNFSHSSPPQQTFKQERSVDLISSLQDQIDILNNKLQNSQKQLIQIKKSKADLLAQKKKSNETIKNTEQLQIQNNLLRNKLVQLQKNIKSKKNNNLVEPTQNTQILANLNKNYFSQGYCKQNDQTKQQAQKRNKFSEKYTIESETTDEVSKKQDQNHKKLGFTFRSEQRNININQASSPYFRNSFKEIKKNKNQCQNVFQFSYIPLPKQQQKINNSVSQFQKSSYKIYQRYEGKGKPGSKHKIIGYIKNDNNNSFLSGSQHQSAISRSNTNKNYKTVNFQIPNSQDQSNQSIIHIVSPVQENQIRCSIDPRNDQHIITLQQFNKQTEQFRKRQKALRKTNQKFLIENRKLKRQKQQIIQSNKLSLTRSQNAQNQQLKILRAQKEQLQKLIQKKEQDIKISNKKYQLYLNQNNKLKADMKIHLKTIKQYRLALYAKDQQIKEEELKLNRNIQSNSTSSKNSIQKQQRKVQNKNFDVQSAVSIPFQKKPDTSRSSKEGFYSSHVVQNKTIKNLEEEPYSHRQLKKSNSSKGITQMKSRIVKNPMTPNIPKPSYPSNSQKGFDSQVNQAQYIKQRKNTVPNLSNMFSLLNSSNK